MLLVSISFLVQKIKVPIISNQSTSFLKETAINILQLISLFGNEKPPYTILRITAFHYDNIILIMNFVPKWFLFGTKGDRLFK